MQDPLENTNVQWPETSGCRHEFRETYAAQKIMKWVNEFENLTAH